MSPEKATRLLCLYHNICSQTDWCESSLSSLFHWVTFFISLCRQTCSGLDWNMHYHRNRTMSWEDKCSVFPTDGRVPAALKRKQCQAMLKQTFAANNLKYWPLWRRTLRRLWLWQFLDSLEFPDTISQVIVLGKRNCTGFVNWQWMKTNHLCWFFYI